MTRQRNIDHFIYGLVDFLTAMLAWACFFMYRKRVEDVPIDWSILEDQNFILGILIILSSLFIAFSKEKSDDEYISKIRLESLVWAVYLNYGILLFSILFIFDLSFLWVMIFNLFTVLLFFIIRFNWQISKLKKSANYEE